MPEGGKKELEKLLDISQTTSVRLLNKMVEKGLLIKQGKGKNTRYQLHMSV